jgi:hypothetical protein
MTAKATRIVVSITTGLAQYDPGDAFPPRDGGADIVLAAHRQRHGACHPRHARGEGDGDGEHGVEATFSERVRNEQRKQQAGNRQDGIVGAHYGLVPATAEIGGKRSDYGAGQRADQGRCDGERNGTARPDQQAAQRVAPELVTAEKELAAGWAKAPKYIHRLGIGRRDGGTEDADNGERKEDHEAEHALWRSQQATRQVSHRRFADRAARR